MTIALGADLPAEAPGGPRASLALDHLPAVTGDPDEIAQVFQNLIDNAVKYGRPGSTVRVALWLAGAERSAPLPAAMRGRGQAAVAVAVNDESDGIPREHLPRLTERFYRVDTARSRDLGGTGLGLAIVKHIMNRHRGALEIDTATGRGSTFVVYLPVAHAPAG
jgi:two-component system phosphate regulon sensor histidine kinase PhoR